LGRGVVAQFFFPTDRSDLDSQDLRLLDQLAAHLKASLKTDRVELAIIGHADYRAPSEYNKQLGMRRAKSVARELNRRLRSKPYFSLFSALATDEKLDRTSVKPLQPASFVHLPAGMPHYAWADGEAIVQINGMGPFDVKYVDPRDDPRLKKSTSQ